MKNLFDKTDPVIVKTGFVGFMTIIAAQLGILFPVLVLLLLCMVVDYITGIISAGYRGKIKSSVGLWGIVKKLLYAVIVAVAIACDWVIINVAEQVGIIIPADTFFGLLVSLWLIFNELISILENLIEMEMTLPGFLIALVDKFKHLIENQGSAAVDAVNVKDKENE